MCERRVWLDFYADDTQRDPLPPMVLHRQQEGAAHERVVQEALSPQREVVPVLSWNSGLRFTRQAMAQGVKAIMGAYFEATLTLPGCPPVVMRGRADRLVRLAASPHVYGVIEIKHYTTLDPRDELQLDAYLWLLSQHQDGEPLGEFWLGRDEDGHPLRTLQHRLDETLLMQVIARAVEVLLSRSEEPPVSLLKHCATCHWYSPCRQVAEKRLDLGLLSGLRADTQTALRSAGISDLREIAAMHPDDLRRFKGIKSTADAHHAHARAWVAGAPVWYGDLMSQCLQGGWFFDIETDPRAGTVWSIGWSAMDGNGSIALVAPHISRPHSLRLPDGHHITLVPDSATAWEVFAAGVAANALPIFHWTGFDAGVMRHSAPEAVRDALDDRLHDLHAAFNRAVKFPVKGSSLKVVAAYLGFAWSVYEAWDAAFNDYNLWLARQDETALARACAYQRDDVDALRVVWRWLVTQPPS